MGRIASLDFGLKRIGIALSDANKKMALPFKTVEGGKRAIETLKKTLPLAEIERIILGLPLEMSGKKGPMAQLVIAFAAELEKAFQIPVELIDERLSSKGADVHLKEISLNGKQRNEKIDMMAAVLLLQIYLDRL